MFGQCDGRQPDYLVRYRRGRHGWWILHGQTSVFNQAGGAYTADGYETVGSPGIIGAVRRNFVWERKDASVDEGAQQSCAMACAQFGKAYEPTYVGYPLHQKVGGGGIITSGLGDLGAMAYQDVDYYYGNTKKIVGTSSRANTWHESEVAQADYCCCQVTTPMKIKLPPILKTNTQTDKAAR